MKAAIIVLFAGRASAFSLFGGGEENVEAGLYLLFRAAQAFRREKITPGCWEDS